MQRENTTLRIDVGEVLSSKNSKLAKIIPNFVIAFLKRLVHQDEINDLLERAGHKEGAEFIQAALERLRISYTDSGFDKLDKSGRYIFASNHPLGGLDGMILIKLITEKFGSVKVLGNDLICHIKPISSLFVPVNKHGMQNRTIISEMNSVFESDIPVLYFPAGLCSRKKSGKICDLPWHKSFVSYALKFGRDIVPVHFSGKNSNRFYRSANIRTALGIKFNYEMLLLPDEMFRQKGRSFEIKAGVPITYDNLKNSNKSASQWAEDIKQETYKLSTL